MCYLNLLAQQVVLAYLQEYEPTAEFEAHGSEFWALGINGSEVILGNQRLLILPTDEFDIDEFRIPQEWVDCAELAADFYVAVQVDTEQRWLRIWGYTTHATLMEKGCYGGRDRTYILAQDAVSESINALWLTRQYYPEAKTQNEIALLPTLSLDQMTSVLSQSAGSTGGIGLSARV